MRPAEILLRAICRGDGELVLVVPREPSGESMRLFGKAGGPRCDVLCCALEGQTTVAVSAKATADWLHDRNLAWTRKADDRTFVCDEQGEIELEVRRTP